MGTSLLLIVSCCLNVAFAGFWDMPTSLPIYNQPPTQTVFQAPAASTRLVNKNGPIGSTSSINGDVGALWPISDSSELSSFLSSVPSHDVIIVLDSTLFNRNNTESLIATKKVKGILVAPSSSVPDAYSPVSAFPQKEYTAPQLYSNIDYKWNPNGDEFAFQPYRTPIFYLFSGSSNQLNQDTANIVSWAAANREKNGKFPQYGAKLMSYMKTSSNSVSCLRRGECEPVGGKTIWSSITNIDPSKEIILAQAGYDSNAFFHDAAPGADSSISGAVGVAAAAYALATTLAQNNMTEYKKQMIFALYAGEQWGYVGSKRFVRDLMNGECPSCDSATTAQFTALKFSNIDSIIELNQVGKSEQSNGEYNFYAHIQKDGVSDALRQKVIIAKQNGVSVSDAATETPGVPPSSAMSFLAQSAIQTVVITEHRAAYTNPYYQSRYDDYSNINSTSVCQAATLLARTMYSVSEGSTDFPASLQANCTLVDELMQCLTKSLRCNLSTVLLYGWPLTDAPSHYTSVWREDQIQGVTPIFLMNLMTALTQTNRSTDIECVTDSDCSTNGLYGHCMGVLNGNVQSGQCVYGRAYFHDALSLAYDLQLKAQPQYWNESTWMESYWDSFYVQTFIMDNPTTEIVVFIFGIISAVVSMVAVFAARKYFNKRFKSF